MPVSNLCFDWVIVLAWPSSKQSTSTFFALSLYLSHKNSSHKHLKPAHQLYYIHTSNASCSTLNFSIVHFRDIPLVLLVTSVAEKARVPRFEPQFFRDFLTWKSPNPIPHSLSRHWHTQDPLTRPIQAQTHPSHTDTAYAGTDTPKTHQHGLSRHRYTQDTSTQPIQAQRHQLPSAHGCQDSQQNGSIGAYPVERIVEIRPLCKRIWIIFFQ